MTARQSVLIAVFLSLAVFLLAEASGQAFAVSAQKSFGKPTTP